VCLAVSAILSGCAQQQQRGASSTTVAQLTLDDIDKAAVIEVAEDVLAGMRFTIEKADVKAGILQTAPLSGAQFFELWRSDNVGAFNTAEANLQSLRRTVELQVSEQGPGQTHVVCRVETERLDIPEQEHVTSSGRAYFLFTKSGQSMQSIQLNPEQQRKMEWVDMGRDFRLETRILSRIQDAVAKKQRNATSGGNTGSKTTERKS